MVLWSEQAGSAFLLTRRRWGRRIRVRGRFLEESRVKSQESRVKSQESRVKSEESRVKGEGLRVEE